MDNYIFKEATLQKRDLYAKIKDIFIEGGWQNISSNEATDFDIFYSNGESGDKNLYFQIRSQYATGGIDINTTTGHSISVKLIYRYIPSSTIGTAGAFERPSEGWRYLILFENTVALNAEVKITYHVNKNRLIIGFETSPTLGLNGNVFLLGMPDNTFNEEKESSGVLLASGISYNHAANTILATNPSYKNSGTTTHLMYVFPTTMDNPLSKNLTLSPIYYGDATEGIRGALDGIFVGNTTTTYKSGDIINSGNKAYKVFILNVSTGSWAQMFPSRFLVLRIK